MAESQEPPVEEPGEKEVQVLNNEDEPVSGGSVGKGSVKKAKKKRKDKKGMEICCF